MELKNVVPWGRSLEEYRGMFALSDEDLTRRILGAGDGPASFNAELIARGGRVVSVDPVYQFSAAQIRSRIDEVYPEVMGQMEGLKEDFVWKAIPDIESLGRIRMAAMGLFLADFEAGKDAGRYVEGALPTLPFADDAFDLALCSHYLFLYSDHVPLEDHIASMLELCRVAREVRVYPLLTLACRVSPHLEPVMAALRQHGIEVDLQAVPYEFQKGAKEMLVARRR